MKSVDFKKELSAFGSFPWETRRLPASRAPSRGMFSSQYPAGRAAQLSEVKVYAGCSKRDGLTRDTNVSGRINVLMAGTM